MLNLVVLLRIKLRDRGGRAVSRLLELRLRSPRRSLGGLKASHRLSFGLVRALHLPCELVHLSLQLTSKQLVVHLLAELQRILHLERALAKQQAAARLRQVLAKWSDADDETRLGASAKAVAQHAR